MTRGSVGHRAGRWVAATIMVSTLAAGGCDTAPGPEQPGLRSPVVSDLVYGPGSVLVDALPPAQVEDGIARVTVTASVSASDPDGDLDRVSFVVRSPVPGSPGLASGDLTRVGGGLYELDAEVEFPTAVTGRYTLVIYPVDRSGRLGNEVRGAIDLLSEGNPPEIVSVEMPDRVTRPATGEPAVPVVIVVTATDPDGLANLLRVETLVNGTTILNLCDDGGAGSCNAGFGPSGDQTAGDGRFTLTLQVEASNAPGSNTFEFTAVDRSDLRSATIIRTIEIE